MIFCEGLLKNNITQTPVGATRLRIISGYATPGVAEKHLNECPGLKIDVLVGITGTGGIPLIHHKGFLALEKAHGDFTCSYSKQKNIHSKLYLWEDALGQPLYAPVCRRVALFLQPFQLRFCRLYMTFPHKPFILR